MKYKYHAYFSLSQDNRICYVSVPALEREYDIQQTNMSRFALIRSAVKEVGFDVYMMEHDGETLPQDCTDNKTKAECSFSDILMIDTDKIAKNVTIIKEFDLS